METCDKQKFKDVFDSLCEVYQRDKLSVTALQIYFASLEKYSIDQVTGSVSRHLADPKAGSYFPKVADIIRHIEGGEVTHDQVLSAARLKNSPFGVLCRIQIGHWDLENQSDMFYLRQRAQECLDLLPQWRDKARSGEYTDHEISIMIKYDVKPSSPFMPGLQGPANHALLDQRAQEIEKSERHQFLLEQHDYDKEIDNLPMNDEVKSFVSEILSEGDLHE